MFYISVWRVYNRTIHPSIAYFEILMNRVHNKNKWVGGTWKTNLFYLHFQFSCWISCYTKGALSSQPRLVDKWCDIYIRTQFLIIYFSSHSLSYSSDILSGSRFQFGVSISEALLLLGQMLVKSLRLNPVSSLINQGEARIAPRGYRQINIISILISLFKGPLKKRVPTIDLGVS